MVDNNRKSYENIKLSSISKYKDELEKIAENYDKALKLMKN